MSTDLKMFVEKRNEDNTWQVVPACEIIDCYRCDGARNGCLVCNDDPNYKGYQVFVCRNYSLFSILADIKNANYLNFISPPKGFPQDACDLMNFEYDMNKKIGHSFSYLTLEEIFNFDWNQTYRESGFVDLKEYSNWVEKGRKGPPDDYYVWITDNDRTIKLSNKEMDKLVAKMKDPELKYMTEVEWQQSYSSMVNNFLQVMNSACKNNDPKDVRIVFWFQP